MICSIHTVKTDHHLDSEICPALWRHDEGRCNSSSDDGLVAVRDPSRNTWIFFNISNIICIIFSICSSFRVSIRLFQIKSFVGEKDELRPKSPTKSKKTLVPTQNKKIPSVKCRCCLRRCRQCLTKFVPI